MAADSGRHREIGAAATLALALFAGGCVRREGRNADCRWPAETSPRAAAARHLSADAEFAEDLAIRYADAHHGLRTPYYVSGEAYAAARDQCLASLYEQIAKEHAVTPADLADALGRNRVPIDLAMNLPFALLYAFAAWVASKWIWRRYPRVEHGWVPGAAMAVFLSLAAAACCAMAGELWSWTMETCRLGNGHMSYRAQRLPWARHRSGLFAGAVAVFCAAAAHEARRSVRHDQQSD